MSRDNDFWQKQIEDGKSKTNSNSCLGCESLSYQLMDKQSKVDELQDILVNTPWRCTNCNFKWFEKTESDPCPECGGSLITESHSSSMLFYKERNDAQDQLKIALEALQNIRDEKVMSGSPLGPVVKYENNLTASMRNIAIEALELIDYKKQKEK